MKEIILGDCLEIMPKFPDHSVDFILCDLPYGKLTDFKWDVKIPLEPLWKEYKRLLKPNGVVALFANEPFTSELIVSNLKWFRYKWIWDKSQGVNFMNLSFQPFKTHEEIVIFSKTSKFTFNPIRIKRAAASLKRDPIGKKRKNTIQNVHATNPFKRTLQFTNRTPSEDGLRHPIDILKFPKTNKGDTYDGFSHPTKKPAKLCEYFVQTYTNPGDLVLDNTAGSGSTGVACERLGRDYILIEKEPEYYEMILKRIQADRDKVALFNGG